MGNKAEYTPIGLKNGRLNNYNGKYVKTSMNLRPNEINFLNKSGYSLTSLMRKTISDKMNDKQHEDIEEMYVKIERLTKLIQQQAQFIENKDLTEQFSAIQDREEEKELLRHKPNENEVKATEIEKECDEVLNIK